MTTSVVCAVRGPAETVVVRALDLAPELTVTRRCADLAELLAAGAAGLGVVAVLSADLPGVDREAVHHLHGSGVWVLALAGGDWPTERLARLGVDGVVPAQEAAAAVVPAVGALLERAARGARPGGAGSGASGAGTVGTTGDRVSSGRTRDRAPDGATARPGGGGVSTAPARPTGTVVAVWGPTGAPGRTTLAVALAAELAAAATDGALLVDADTYGGAVAPVLGLLDEAPGIAAACRAAAAGRLDPVSLAALTPQLDSGLRVLTGIGRAERWPEVPAASLEAVWATARRLAGWTVVDTGFCLERDEVLSYDTRAPHRNAATLSALAEADVVVVVGTGDPIGLQRLVRALGDLTDAGVGAERRVVVNRVRASASGPRPAEAIRDALARYAGVGRVHVVPQDTAACDGALLAARTLLEHAPASPARRAVAELATVMITARASLLGA